MREVLVLGFSWSSWSGADSNSRGCVDGLGAVGSGDVDDHCYSVRYMCAANGVRCLIAGRSSGTGRKPSGKQPSVAVFNRMEQRGGNAPLECLELPSQVMLHSALSLTLAAPNCSGCGYCSCYGDASHGPHGHNQDLI